MHVCVHVCQHACVLGGRGRTVKEERSGRGEGGGERERERDRKRGKGKREEREKECSRLSIIQAHIRSKQMQMQAKRALPCQEKGSALIFPTGQDQAA